mgnify:CR=1 FL=1
MKIQVTGLLEAVRANRARAARLVGGTPRALRDALTDTLRDVWTSFDQQRQVGGRGWAPLARGTLRQKLRLGYSPKALIRTGALRQGWEIQVRGNTGTLRATATGKRGVPYGVYQHEGTRTIPARPFTPTEAVVRAHARAAFQRLIKEAL